MDDLFTEGYAKSHVEMGRILGRSIEAQGYHRSNFPTQSAVMKRLNPVIKSSALNSILIEWEPIAKCTLDGNGMDGAEKHHLYTVQYCVGGDTKNWVNAYRGHKTFREIKNLEPGNYYNIRVGFSISATDKVIWSKLLIATTKEEPVAITDIQEAIQKGNLSSLRHLISSRLALVDIYNTRGLTPLMEASATGDIGAIGILLWAGSTVDQGSAGVGKTALMISLQNGHIKAAMKLCEAGAQWETKDRRGCTPLHYAVEASQVEAVHFALVNGANLEAKDNYGWTPLMRALITRSSIATLVELLTNGANVNIEKTASNKDTGMLTPLMCAVLFTHGDQDPHAKTIKLLIQHGAKTEELNPYGFKAAEMALAKGCKTIAHDMEYVG